MKGAQIMAKNRTVSLTGKNSNEIYSLRYPDSVLRFASYDFSGFIKRCTDYCKRCEANREYRIEDIISLRTAVCACHKYVEANAHGLYEKIIQDFFIEYICRERGIGTTTLWNDLINAQSPFEKLLFTRLTEYRHNKGVNQWVNLLKLQEYAKRKIDFIFSEKTDITGAYAKRDYFDLAFGIAANEMGYPSDCFTGACLYSVGRLPSAPFIVNNVSKAIAKQSLPEIEYSGQNVKRFSPLKADSEAMDVFTVIKNYIPEKPDSVLKTIITTMRSMPKRVYVSESFKAVIDLEIDLLLESGGVLQHCERCGEFFLRDEEYDHDYCSRPQTGGRTCLEISTALPPRTPEEVRELDDMTGELYAYMSRRINVDLTQREFAEWYQSFMAIKESILHNTLSIAEFKEFDKYSRELRFTPARPAEEKPAGQPAAPDKGEAKPAQQKVKPFVFERIDRSALYEQENRRRRQEQLERELEESKAEEEQQQEQQDISAAVSGQPVQTVRVVKAEQAQAFEVDEFKNPFDGVFDEGISELEKVNKRELDPLDSIFDFGDDINETPSESDEIIGKTEIRVGDEEIELPVMTEADDGEQPDSGFAGAIARASYMRSSKAGYAAGMYRRTAEMTLDIPDDAEITGDDFDILPSKPDSVIQNFSSEGVKKTEEKAERKPKEKSAPPVITLGDFEQTPPDEIPGNEKRRKSTRNSGGAKRLLDGIIKPSKNRNPFLDDGNEE